MELNAALKRENSVKQRALDASLLARFVEIINLRGYTNRSVGARYGKSHTWVSLVKNGKYRGDLDEAEQIIRSFLEHEEHSGAYKVPDFVLTAVAKNISLVLQMAELHCDMGLVTGPAGIGKTVTARNYCKKYKSAIYVVADVTRKSVGATLDMIGEPLSGCNRRGRNSTYLQEIISYLRDSRRLLIIDEAHFLSWESFELCRKIHDCAGIGLVFLGQEFIVNQMKGGRKAFLWDQLYSRIGVRYQIWDIGKSDATMLAEAFCPGISDECLKYLQSVASEKGRFRVMTKLLQRAIALAQKEGVEITVPLLRETRSLLGFQHNERG